MSYEPTVWAANDVITAAKMNKIEHGIENSSGGGSLIVNVIEESETNVESLRGSNGASTGGTATEAYRLDKTAGEIVNAINNGMVVWLFGNAVDEETGLTAQNKMLLPQVTITTGDSGSTYEFITRNITFEATSLDDYPTFSTDR